LILDRHALQVVGAEARAGLALVFIVSFAGLLFHEAKTPSPVIDFSLFKIRMFSLGALSLLLVSSCYVVQAFLFPFYLQEVLHLSPSAIGLIFMALPIATVAVAPLSGYLTDRLGPRLSATLGVVFLFFSLLVGGFLRPDSHWLLPTFMIALGGITNGVFNPANAVSLVSMMPREHRGFASGANHVVFGLGNVLGVALSGVMMTAAFEYHTGISGIRPSAENPAAFVAALNTALLITMGASGLAIITSLMRGK
jgi:predicted MFS family arabinose efflux permease